MNIFMLDANPRIAATYHCDKHVVKMILESAQLLCAAHHLNNTPTDIPYKLTHKGHPCTKWVSSSLSNYLFTLELAKGLLLEYTKRYGKVHKCTDVIKWAEVVIPKFTTEEPTTPAQAMPDEYKQQNHVEAYRRYYKHKTTVMDVSYKLGNTPEWLKGE